MANSNGRTKHQASRYEERRHLGKRPASVEYDDWLFAAWQRHSGNVDIPMAAIAREAMVNLLIDDDALTDDEAKLAQELLDEMAERRRRNAVNADEPAGVG